MLTPAGDAAGGTRGLGTPSWRAVVAVASEGLGERAADDPAGRRLTPLGDGGRADRPRTSYGDAREPWDRRARGHASRPQRDRTPRED